MHTNQLVAISHETGVVRDFYSIIYYVWNNADTAMINARQAGEVIRLSQLYF